MFGFTLKEKIEAEERRQRMESLVADIEAPPSKIYHMSDCPWRTVDLSKATFLFGYSWLSVTNCSIEMEEYMFERRREDFYRTANGHFVVARQKRSNDGEIEIEGADMEFVYSQYFKNIHSMNRDLKVFDTGWKPDEEEW